LTIANIKPFEKLALLEQKRYIEKARFVQKFGLHTEVDVIQLANTIYNKDPIHNER
jgi:hypothetical protein|tara:strand:+ start:1116 stop:1283 length:168 start_codon:yes stop_codon:yes gene_type:complete